MRGFTTCLLIYFTIVCHIALYSNEKPKEINKLKAVRITQKPLIDGKLNDEVWTRNYSSYEGNFIQNSPKNGDPSQQKTMIYLVYDDFAIYIAARMFDNTDAIRKELGARDSQERNADMFGVGFDTYHNRQNAFIFQVSAAGVQTDMVVTPNNEDISWNAVWNSAVQIDEQGWTVEIEIPYSALRFPKQENQTWGINFMRIIKRNNERSFWNYVDASMNGFVNQFGDLYGLENIEPPPRFSAIPYISTYFIADQANHIKDFTFSGGLDIKYGINESYTLDMTLIPDFGQVVSDNLVLNLSPFEVRFQENRPFFTEGTEIFNKGDLFYSRRVGRHYGILESIDEEKDTIISEENEAPLINATKISGRGKKGLGIGFFNAITNRTYAKVKNKETGKEREILSDPLTNFNVLVFDQNLRNNSNVSLINTNVMRSDGADHANVTGVSVQFNDKDNVYQMQGFAGLSQIFSKEESQNYKAERGFTYFWFLGKVSGKWQFNFSQRIVSDNYDINDLGFLPPTNGITHLTQLSYNIFKPKKKLLLFRQFLTLEHQNKLYQSQDFAQVNIRSFTRLRFKNFWNMGISFGGNPNVSNDYFEPRNEGYYFKRNPSYYISVWLGTDSRKKFAIEGWSGFWRRPSWSQFDNWSGFWARYRANDRFSFSHNLESIWTRKERGYVNTIYIDEDESEIENIIFGVRDRINIENIFNTKYTFNNKINLTLRLRHYWSEVIYNNEFFNLQNKGTLTFNPDYTGLDEDGNYEHNRNVNAFNMDLVFSWQFAPGSFMSAVWKDIVFTDESKTGYSFGRNLENTLNSDQFHNFSLKIIYFLDYLNVKKIFSKKSKG